MLCSAVAAFLRVGCRLLTEGGGGGGRPNERVNGVVLTDMVRMLTSNKFVTGILHPQHPYSTSTLRHVFDKLAHCSIMRLSEASMGKVRRRLCLFGAPDLFVLHFRLDVAAASLLAVGSVRAPLPECAW